jgi:hypothetical protein
MTRQVAGTAADPEQQLTAAVVATTDSRGTACVLPTASSPCCHHYSSQLTAAAMGGLSVPVHQQWLPYYWQAVAAAAITCLQLRLQPAQLFPCSVSSLSQSTIPNSAAAA